MAESRRRRADRQSGDDRAGRRDGVPFRIGIAQRRGQKSLGRFVLDVRFFFRLGRHCRGGTRCVRNRDGNMGIDPLPLRFLRDQRAAANVWAREPLRGDGAFLLHGQDRAHGTFRGRLRANLRRNRGPRPERPQHSAIGQSGLHIHAGTGAQSSAAAHRLADERMEADGQRRRQSSCGGQERPAKALCERARCAIAHRAIRRSGEYHHCRGRGRRVRVANPHGARGGPNGPVRADRGVRE